MLPLLWWVLDIRSSISGLDRVVEELFFLRGIGLPEADQGKVSGEFMNTEVDTLVNSFNKALTESASEILSKRRAVKRPWVTTSILDLCDERRALKKGRHETAEGARKYRAINHIS